MKYLLTFFLLILISFSGKSLLAQRNPAKGADEAFDRKMYTIAAERYKKAFNRVKKKSEERDRISFRMAECYRLTGSYKRAEATYKRVLRTEYPKKHPEIYLYFAEVLKMNQKFSLAIENYNKYTELVPDDPRGPAGAETAAMIEDWIKNPSKYEVSVLKKVNSRESDFAASWASPNFNEIIFTSTRDGSTGKEKDGWLDQNFSDLFISRLDRKNEWSTPVPVDKSGVVNTKASEGAPMMNSTFNKLYFTRCDNYDKRTSGCRIYTSTRSGRDWGKPTPVQISGVDTLDIVGHPTLSEDELMMYFAAERKGGFGGKDIWVTTREKKTDPFKRPMNIGPGVNTKGDEIFPFLRNDTTLYFSSNGHGGMGGLDIFVSNVDTSGAWTSPRNLKSPVNSTGDDFSIVFHPEEERGFFSSNRENPKGIDNLFYFIEPPVLFTIAGTVKDEKTLQYVESATIQLISSNGMTLSTRTNDKGYFLFGNSQVTKNTTYEIVVDKENYFTKSAMETTVGVEFSKDFVKDFMLDPIPQKPIALPDILYDLARWELKPQYEDSLQGLITTLQLNPTLVIELASHTDNRDTEEKNDILSQRRAQSVVDFLILRGIDAERLVARGYGERVPRELENTFTVNGSKFEAGTVLSEAYINALPTNEMKEVAHQLNRRTEFRILSKDFIPKAANQPINQEVTIAINPDDDKIAFVVAPDGTFLIPCYVADHEEKFVYDKTSVAMISLKKALELLKEGTINKESFEGEVDKIISTGSIADKAVFKISQIRIADKTLKDVKLTVSHALKSDFVFGQELLNQYGEFKIDPKSKTLYFK
ncbi:MAG: OmpA family protein [Bacteroidales bacterium]